ncbi:MAG: HD-GYP domain-containing protein [Pirellulales bacterium]|nr:HD-GYP domain-containing protein [Pirellulales bacterium]
MQIWQAYNWLSFPVVAHALALHEELVAALAAPCGVWAKQSQWHCILGDAESHANSVEHSSSAPLSSSIPQILAGYSLGAKVVYVPQPEGGEIFIAPVADAGQVPVVVCGYCPPGPSELIQKLIASVTSTVNLRMQLENAQTKLRAYVNQVTTDFEELTWLRGLAEQLEVCNLRNDMHSVAATVLPSLRDLINAEAIVFIDETVNRVNSLAADNLEQWADYMTGDLEIDPEEYRRLLRPSAADIHIPPVRNAPQRSLTLPGCEKLRNVIAIRISRNEQHFGWLLVLNKRLPHVDDDDVLTAGCLSSWEFGTFEVGLANAAATMLATHARNIQQFQEKEALLVGVIRALANSIDAKDPYTCGHSDRVARIARVLARELGCEPRECEQIYMSGLLHDLGKIGVPDEILTKPGKLTDEEYAVIKRHPEIGYNILKHLRHLEYVLPGVLHHHESYNGQGYPHGLQGMNIPFPARVLAVADALDAMTSCRPYRTAMPLEKAESILRSGAGSQWDPRVVDAYFAVSAEIKDICGRDQSHMQLLLRGREMFEETGTLPPDWDTIGLAVNAMAMN